MKMIQKNATTTNTTTTGATVDRINLKHAVREFVKYNALRNSESKRGYIVAHATKTAQDYIIARKGRMSNAQVLKFARDNSERVLLIDTIADRAVVVVRA